MTKPYPDYWDFVVFGATVGYLLLFLGSFFMSLSNLKSHRWIARAPKWTYLCNVGLLFTVLTVSGELLLGRDNMPCVVTLGMLYMFPILVVGPIIVRFYIYHSIVRMLYKTEEVQQNLGRSGDGGAVLMSHYLYMKTKANVGGKLVTGVYIMAFLAHASYLGYVLLQVGENHPELQTGCRLGPGHFAVAGGVDLFYFTVAAFFMYVLWQNLKTDKSTGFDVGVELMVVLLSILLCGLPVIIVNLRWYVYVERIFPIEILLIGMAYLVTIFTLLVPTIYVNMRSADGDATRVDLSMFDSKNGDSTESLEMTSLMMVQQLPDVKTVLAFPHHVSNMCLFVSRGRNGKPISRNAADDQQRKSAILAAARLIALLDLEEITQYAWNGFANIFLATNNGQNILWLLKDYDVKDGKCRERVITGIFSDHEINRDALIRSELRPMLDACCTYIRDKYLPRYMESEYFMSAMEAVQQNKPHGQPQEQLSVVSIDDGAGIQ